MINLIILSGAYPAQYSGLAIKANPKKHPIPKNTNAKARLARDGWEITASELRPRVDTSSDEEGRIAVAATLLPQLPQKAVPVSNCVPHFVQNAIESLLAVYGPGCF
jgi:hypothetical protein